MIKLYNKYIGKKKYKYINFFNYLNSIKKRTKNYFINFNKLKYFYNPKKKKNIKLNKKAIFYSLKKNGGYLKINDWKKKVIYYNFFFQSFINDNKIYNFWNMKFSYYKYIYSKINIKHPNKYVYDLSNRSLLIYPFSIKIKPYTILLKNYFFKNNLIIYEWSNFFSKKLFLVKIAKKYYKFKNKNKIINKIKFNKIVYFTKFNSRKYNISVIDNLRNKIKFLFWRSNNWLWRYRNNWIFLTLHKNLTFNYQHYLLKKFKINFFNKYKLYKLPKNVFLEKFFKKPNNKVKIFRKNLYRFKDLYLSKKVNKMIYNKLYKLYNYWFLYLFNKLYNIINKLYFGIFFNFCYLKKQKEKIYSLINLNYKNFLFSLNKIKNNLFNYLLKHKNNKIFIFKNLEKINNNLTYFKNINNYDMITNFFNEYNYNIIINFKKSITQTSRFINFYLSKKINHLNLDNIEFTFLEINQYLLNLSKIKFYKINLNHKNLGYISNIKDICSKNYELIENNNKKLYYI